MDDNARASKLSALRTSRYPHGTVGSEGLWIFVFIDMAIFALLFFVFMADRLEHFALYKTSQPHLNEIFGLVNTLVLLTSSWLVVEAVHAARAMRPARCALSGYRGFSRWRLSVGVYSASVNSSNITRKSVLA